MKENVSCRKAAAAVTAFLVILSLSSLIYLLLPAPQDSEYIADIFQNGVLIESIPLSEAQEQTFAVRGENGCVNVIQIRSGSIGILSADCPDKLCVRQGFIRDSRLPLTCLPNRLVIRLRPVSESVCAAPDAISY